MLTSNINFCGKIIALTLLALYYVGYATLCLAGGFVIINIPFTILALIATILYSIGENRAIYIIRYYVLCLAVTLIDVSIATITLVIIPYLVHKLKKYNWLIYMCNFLTPSNSDALLHVYSSYVPIEIFSELKYECDLELELFQERLFAEDCGAITLMLGYPYNRLRKFEWTVHHMNNGSNYQYIDALLNNQYYLADIFSTLGNLKENINLQFVDALLIHGGNEIRPEYFDIKIRSTRMILLDYILTKLGPTSSRNILDRLDAYLVQILCEYSTNIDSVRMLLKHGANPNVDDGSLIIKSSKQQSIEILDLLLQYGGDITVNDHYVFKYSTVEKKRVLATYLANRYSFYHVMSDGDNLIGTISNVLTIKNANN